MNPVTYRVFTGDCIESMRGMESGCVNCCVTSPPYFGLRDYGHPGQLGQEPTPDEYVANMVEVFRCVLDLLADDGTMWLNLGDSYAGGGTIGRNDTGAKDIARRSAAYGTGTGAGSAVGAQGHRPAVVGLKPKNLIGIPWRVAFALQADGWYLRQEIIWHKPNPMPEPVADRCTKAHEHIFLLSKSARYYYDAEAVKEKAAKGSRGFNGSPTYAAGDRRDAGRQDNAERFTRNRHSVWTVATTPYKGAHFATFPPDLIEPCILAGCPVGGTVLDPFGGSGTTAQVALQHRRNAVLCELNPEYVGLIHERMLPVVDQTRQMTLFGEEG